MSGAVQRRGTRSGVPHERGIKKDGSALPDKGAAPACRAAASPRPTFVGAHSMRPRAADSRPYGMRVS